jgi:hypothetical protein
MLQLASNNPRKQALLTVGRLLLSAAVKGIENFLATRESGSQNTAARPTDGPQAEVGKTGEPTTAGVAGDNKPAQSRFMAATKELAKSIGQELVAQGLETMNEFLQRTDTGDDVAQSLRNLGVDPQELQSVEDMLDRIAVLRSLTQEIRSYTQALLEDAKEMQKKSAN